MVLKIRRCKSGRHHYDSDVHDRCPHCSASHATVRRGPVSVATSAHSKDAETQTRLKPKQRSSIESLRNINSGRGSAEAISGSISASASVTTRAATATCKTVSNLREHRLAIQDSRTSVQPKIYPNSLPAVGWLLVIGSADKRCEIQNNGRDFVLTSGSNRIGRGSDLDVILDIGDSRIAADCHCILTYDTESNKYFLQPGPGRELTHVNRRIDEKSTKSQGDTQSDKEQEWQVVLSTVEIATNSVIRLGDTRLLFIALCGPDFRWKYVVDESS